MRFATFAALAFLLLWSFPSLMAADPAGAGEVVIGFTGGSTWTSNSTGICVWYLPVVGDLDLASLFAKDKSGYPAIDKEHAYFIWVSDWRIQAVYGNGPTTLALVPTGEATIYFSLDPTSRKWSDLTNRSTWGMPVARFVRGGGVFHSPDATPTAWPSAKFFFSARLVSSESIELSNGKRFNFRNVIPHGMTCFEFGQNSSASEVGACTAMGGGS
jgi:hypothetical protein